MPRYRRQIAEGSLQHVISRFVQREFVLDLCGARTEYLARAAPALGRSGWDALAFALMSSHIHWALRAGTRPSAALVQPLHAGFARWVNRREGRLGPVFADRHRSLTFEGDTAAALLAYIHNNPVRAKMVSDPADSPWTSHRAYLGLSAPPPWLNVELGLHLCGFSSAPSGRLAFHEMVLRSKTEARRPDLSGDDLQARRRRARAEARRPVELATPTVSLVANQLEVRAAIVAPPDCPDRPRFRGGAERVLHAVAEVTQLPIVMIQSRNRARVLASARRLALVVWTQVLGRPAVEMTATLGIASSSGSELIRTAHPETMEEAKRIALRLVEGASADETEKP